MKLIFGVIVMTNNRISYPFIMVKSEELYYNEITSQIL